jgi:phosphoribosylanthranilate isomerase
MACCRAETYPLWVKICGVTSVDQARVCVEAGADAIGVNLVPSSPRRIATDRAREIAEAMAGRTLVVAVVADLSLQELGRVRSDTGIRWLQLSGSEEPELVAELQPEAYKGIRIGSAEDVSLAARYSGDRVLVDAKVEGALGGTGRSFDWSLVSELARTRRVVLAGGLRPDNVARAVAVVRPFGVDVASGIERAPGDKDPEAVRRFIEQARSAT